MENKNRTKKQRAKGKAQAAGGARARDHARAPHGGGAAPQSMALSVTRHAGISREDLPGPGGYGFLAAGIDSLDLGLYVDWGQTWPKLFAELESGRERAAGSEGIAWDAVGGFKTLLYPGGRKMYRFHLKTSVGELYIGKTSLHEGGFSASQTPNVRIEISAESMWINGIEGSLAYVDEAVRSLGGSILGHKVSRVDLCADYELPGGLQLDSLLLLVVCRSSAYRPFLKKGALETFYAGEGKTPLQVRIYDKSKEIAQNPSKRFMRSVWGIKGQADVWRVEAQMRRPFLKQMGVNGVEDLKHKAAGVWGYVTGSWFSLRAADSPNATRRTVLPWWADVQSRAGVFGTPREIKRQYALEGTMPVRWYVNQMTGFLASYAVRIGVHSLDEALAILANEIKRTINAWEFERRCELKALKLGIKVPAPKPKPDELSGGGEFNER